MLSERRVWLWVRVQASSIECYPTDDWELPNVVAEGKAEQTHGSDATKAWASMVVEDRGSETGQMRHVAVGIDVLIGSCHSRRAAPNRNNFSLTSRIT